MKTKLLNLWEKLHSTYWFLPGLMALGSVLLALGVLAVDRQWGTRMQEILPWRLGNEPEGARAFLSTVAGATMTVTGVVFSVTVVALSLASQQFGPRLLNNFMRDRGNQVVFGIFVATYLYCLVVLRTIRGDGQDAFVPQASFMIGFLLALFSLGVLIYFIHHVAESIQAMTVIAKVSEDLHRAVARHFPPRENPPSERPGIVPKEIPAGFETEALDLRAEGFGYVQAVDESGLLALAESRDLLLRVEIFPGQFVLRGAVLARAWPPDRAKEEELEKRVNRAFILGPERSPEQGIDFLVHELVEIALRALSPGINDPFTAINCIDHLGSALRELAGGVIPSPYLFDREDRLRLVVRRQTFGGVADEALDQIRQHGRGYAAITIRLLKTIAAILPHTRAEEERRPLLRQAAMIEQGAEALPVPEDRQAVHECYLEVYRVLERNFGLSGEGR